jgi:hypothetical protein
VFSVAACFVVRLIVKSYACRLRAVALDMFASSEDSNLHWRDEPDKLLQFFVSGQRELSFSFAMYEWLKASHALLHV